MHVSGVDVGQTFGSITHSVIDLHIRNLRPYIKMADIWIDKFFWSSFIQLYKDNECLWNIRSQSYSDRTKEGKAYELLVAQEKEKIPDTTKYTVVKRINNMRSSFRKELK